MADLSELVNLMSEGGPAQAVKAGVQGFQEGRQRSFEERKRAFQQKLQEAGLVSGAEANTLAGEEIFDPSRSLQDTVVGSLTNLRTNKNKGTPTAKDALELQELQSRIDKNKASITNSKRARDQADKRLALTEGAPKREAQAKALKDLQDVEAAVPNLMASLESIRAAAKDLPAFEPGFFNQAVGKVQMKGAEFSKDPAVEKYLGIVAQNLSPLARGIAQEKGPLTDKDVDRIMQGLGELTTPVATREALLNELVDKVTRSLEARRKNVKNAGSVAPALNDDFIKNLEAQGFTFEGVEEDE
ncbi:MAG: hypothetical protein AB7V39_00485 [Nitrospiraceae bacterium]